MKRRVALLVLAAAVPGAAFPATEEGRAPRIRVEPASFDFGKVKPGRVLRKEFRLRNLGDTNLEIERLSWSCECTGAETDARSLPPGGSTALRVEVETPDLPGEVDLQVLVVSNDPDTPSLEIRLRATVVAAR